MLPASEFSCDAVRQTKRLQDLYTRHVFSDRAVRLFNLGFGRMAHVVAEGVDPVAARPGVVKEFWDYIVFELLKVDEHPTYSRMFTFRGCLDCMLAMGIHGIPLHCFSFGKKTPQKRSQRRMNSVQTFYKDGSSGQYLRRTSLCCQLSGHITAFVCTKDAGHVSEDARGFGYAPDAEVSRPATSGVGGDPPLPATSPKPLLVRLYLGEVQREAADVRSVILENCDADPALDVGAMFSVLLATELEIDLRFEDPPHPPSPPRGPLT